MTTSVTPAVDSGDEPWDVLLSSLEHFSYCPRQCGLIHIEQSYAENRFTIRGSHAHERVDSGEMTTAEGVKVWRSIPLWSEKLGLRGKADVVEIQDGVPYPVEYKVGKRYSEHAALQLCAEAFCLEEMLGVSIPSGALYSHAERRREEVQFDASLRNRTMAVIERIRTMLHAQSLPKAVNDARCRNCSLLDVCLPDVVANEYRIRGLHGALYQTWDVADADDEGRPLP